MMRSDGTNIERFKVRKLMGELKLISKQPGSHAYKTATVERPDIPNELDRELNVSAPNEVWCGDITYVWAQGRWHYVVAVFDLYAPREMVLTEARCRIGDQGAGHGIRAATVAHRMFCSTAISAVNLAARFSANGCGDTALNRA